MLLEHRNVALELGAVHVHLRLRNDTADNHVLGLLDLGAITSLPVFGVVLDYVLNFGHDNLRVGHLDKQRKRTRVFHDQTRSLLGVANVLAVHLGEYVSEFDASRTSQRSFDDEATTGRSARSSTMSLSVFKPSDFVKPLDLKSMTSSFGVKMRAP